MKTNLGWPLEPTFYVPEEVNELFAQRRREHEEQFHKWEEMFSRYTAEYPEMAGL